MVGVLSGGKSLTGRDIRTLFQLNELRVCPGDSMEFLKVRMQERAGVEEFLSYTCSSGNPY